MPDSDEYLEGEGDTLSYGDLKLDLVEFKSVVELLEILADHASRALANEFDGLTPVVRRRHDAHAQLEWLRNLIERRADALKALPKSTTYLGRAQATVTWTDAQGECWTFSPATALWELLSQAVRGGFPSVMESHARQFLILHGNRIADL